MQEDSSLQILTTSGPQTIREVADTRALILDAFRGTDDALPTAFVLDCTAVTDADVCFLQLVLAASRSASRAGRKFSLRLPPRGTLRDTLVRGGFIDADGATAEQPDQWCGRASVGSALP